MHERTFCTCAGLQKSADDFLTLKHALLPAVPLSARCVLGTPACRSGELGEQWDSPSPRPPSNPRPGIKAQVNHEFEDIRNINDIEPVSKTGYTLGSAPPLADTLIGSNGIVSIISLCPNLGLFLDKAKAWLEAQHFLQESPAALKNPLGNHCTSAS